MITLLIQVNQVSGRVYILKFNTDDRKFFFWMQVKLIFHAFHPLICNIDFASSFLHDFVTLCVKCLQEPKAEEDSQLCSSVNYYINLALGKFLFHVLSPWLTKLPFVFLSLVILAYV